MPPGPYLVSVTLLGRDGSRRPIRIALDYDVEPVESVAIDWTGDGVCDFGTGLDWTDIYLEWPEF